MVYYTAKKLQLMVSASMTGKHAVLGFCQMPACCSKILVTAEIKGMIKSRAGEK